MSKIWSYMIILSIIIAIFFGMGDKVISAIMDGSKSAIENVITLCGMMCFWSGIFKIFENTSGLSKFSKFFSKILGFLFNKKDLTDKAKEYISLNVTSNIVGVGNASTLNGIKAMEEMQKTNSVKDTASDNMTTFVLLNSASLQLIPTSMIALRALYNSENPSEIIIPIWIVTFFSLLAGIICIKILNKRM